MKTLIFSVPATLDFAMLTPTQQAAVQSVVGAWMDVGVPVNGRKLLDVIVNDNYTEASRALYFPDWIVVYEANWTGAPDSVTHDPVTGAEMSRIPALTVLTPLTADYLTHMPNNPDGSRPLVARELASWAGWPKRF